MTAKTKDARVFPTYLFRKLYRYTARRALAGRSTSQTDLKTEAKRIIEEIEFSLLDALERGKALSASLPKNRRCVRIFLSGSIVETQAVLIYERREDDTVRIFALQTLSEFHRRQKTRIKKQKEKRSRVRPRKEQEAA